MGQTSSRRARLVLQRINHYTFVDPDSKQIYRVPQKDGLIRLGARPNKADRVPEINLSSVLRSQFCQQRPKIVPNHVILEWVHHGLKLRAGSGQTWHQRALNGQIRRLGYRDTITLGNSDLLIFGHPSGAHVAFRVELH
tara:strand:+ start:77 stop:493 length:417 start_codon:yes stop_codon:yes gene_type:complete